MLGDLLRKSVATGLGIAWLTKERAEDFVGEWVRQGKISLDQRKEAVDRLMREAEEQRGELMKFVNTQTSKALATAGLARLSDLKALEERVAALEQRLGEGGTGTQQ